MSDLASVSPPAVGQQPARFAVWRLVVWLVLLFALEQLRQSLHGLWLLWHSGSSGSAALPELAWWMLPAWVALAAIIMVAAACLLGRRWARGAMRIVAALLAWWLLAGMALTIAEWHALAGADGALLRQVFGHAGALLAARLRGAEAIDLAFELVGMLGLTWLVWQLGRPALREAFAATR